MARGKAPSPPLRFRHFITARRLIRRSKTSGRAAAAWCLTQTGEDDRAHVDAASEPQALGPSGLPHARWHRSPPGMSLRARLLYSIEKTTFCFGCCSPLSVYPLPICLQSHTVQLCQVCCSSSIVSCPMHRNHGPAVAGALGNGHLYQK